LVDAVGPSNSNAYRTLRTFSRSERGGSVVEYLIVLGLLSLGLVGYRAFGANVSGTATELGKKVASLESNQVTVVPGVAKSGAQAQEPGQGRTESAAVAVTSANGARVAEGAAVVSPFDSAHRYEGQYDRRRRRGGNDGARVVEPPKPPRPNFDNVVYTELPKGVGKAFIEGAPGEGSVHPNDVAQGAIGDCYFISALAAVARTNPGVIESGITTLPNDAGFRVRVFDAVNGRWTWITSEGRSFPTVNGQPLFAQPGDSTEKNVELWPMLY